MMRLTRIAATLLTCAVLAGCGTDPITRPYLVLNSAAQVTDTTLAKVADLVVQVRDSSGKTGYKNLTVRFATDVVTGTGTSSPVANFIDADGNHFSSGQAYTNSNGIVDLKMQLGSIPGSGDVHISLGGANSTATVHVTITAPVPPPVPAAGRP